MHNTSGAMKAKRKEAALGSQATHILQLGSRGESRQEKMLDGDGDREENEPR